MKKALWILPLAALPSLALAAGNHEAGGHDMNGMHKQPHEMSSTMHEQEDPRIGRPGDPAKVDRTVEIHGEDGMRYVPDRITVKAGETVRFLVRNTGRLTHELVIGSLSELKEHAESMRKMPGMKHTEPNMISLKSGQRGSIVWQFGAPGTVHFACTEPGHMEAGMTGVVEVEK